MSRENVDIVRGLFDAFNRGDFDACLDALADDVVWQHPPDMPGGGTGEGKPAVAQTFAQWMGAWEMFRGDAEELIDAGDRVVAVTRMRGRGKESGAEIDQTTAQVFELRDGKVARVLQFRDRADALAAAGSAD